MADGFEISDGVSLRVDETVLLIRELTPRWKFSQGGDSSFYAAVLDEEFLRQVALHEMTFGKGDLLPVKLRLRVTQTEEGLAPLREVVKVLEKISPPKQKEMFESDDE